MINWRSCEIDLGWLLATKVGSDSNKCYYTANCRCGNEYVFQKQSTEIVKSFRSSKVFCENCYIENASLPSKSWKWASDCKRYRVSEDGVVINNITGKPLPGCLLPNGERKLLLGLAGGKRKQTTLHRLLAELFLENLNDDKYVNFKDGDRSNCKLSNLEWGPRPLDDLEGVVFGSLTAIRLERGKGSSKTSWYCSCSCGNFTSVVPSELITGHVKSCGCYRSVILLDRNLKHGHHGTPEYSSWQAAKTRCFNPNIGHYHNYGGRGITMCEEWVEDFGKFLEDMGERPSSDHTLERLDVDGNYCKDNCTWADRRTQAYNRRKSVLNTSGKTGVTLNDCGKWRVSIGNKYLGLYDNLEDAISVRKLAELEVYGLNKE